MSFSTTVQSNMGINAHGYRVPQPDSPFEGLGEVEEPSLKAPNNSPPTLKDQLDYPPTKRTRITKLPTFSARPLSEPKTSLKFEIYLQFQRKKRLPPHGKDYIYGDWNINYDPLIVEGTVKNIKGKDIVVNPLVIDTHAACAINQEKNYFTNNYSVFIPSDPSIDLSTLALTFLGKPIKTKAPFKTKSQTIYPFCTSDPHSVPLLETLRYYNVKLPVSEKTQRAIKCISYNLSQAGTFCERVVNVRTKSPSCSLTTRLSRTPMPASVINLVNKLIESEQSKSSLEDSCP